MGPASVEGRALPADFAGVGDRPGDSTLSDAEDQPEPTMEEILASIRRIISEDGEVAEEAGDEVDDEDVLVLQEPAPEAELEPILELSREEHEEEVFELTEVLEEEDEPEFLILDDVIEEEPGPVFETESEYEPEPESFASSAPATTDAESEGLISREVEEQTTADFANFTSAVSSAQGLQLGAAHRTLEDLVKELLRPMLKDWLDNNLQPIVSRTVEREIAKLAGPVDED